MRQPRLPRLTRPTRSSSPSRATTTPARTPSRAPRRTRTARTRAMPRSRTKAMTRRTMTTMPPLAGAGSGRLGADPAAVRPRSAVVLPAAARERPKPRGRTTRRSRRRSRGSELPSRGRCRSSRIRCVSTGTPVNELSRVFLLTSCRHPTPAAAAGPVPAGTPLTARRSDARVAPLPGGGICRRLGQDRGRHRGGRRRLHLSVPGRTSWCDAGQRQLIFQFCSRHLGPARYR